MRGFRGLLNAPLLPPARAEVEPPQQTWRETRPTLTARRYLMPPKGHISQTFGIISGFSREKGNLTRRTWFANNAVWLSSTPVTRRTWRNTWKDGMAWIHLRLLPPLLPPIPPRLQTHQAVAKLMTRTVGRSKVSLDKTLQWQLTARFLVKSYSFSTEQEFWNYWKMYCGILETAIIIKRKECLLLIHLITLYILKVHLKDH